VRKLVYTRVLRLCAPVSVLSLNLNIIYILALDPRGIYISTAGLFMAKIQFFTLLFSATICII